MLAAGKVPTAFWPKRKRGNCSRLGLTWTKAASVEDLLITPEQLTLPDP